VGETLWHSSCEQVFCNCREKRDREMATKRELIECQRSVALRLTGKSGESLAR
jgi:hypothetical protein